MRSYIIIFIHFYSIVSHCNFKEIYNATNLQATDEISKSWAISLKVYQTPRLFRIIAMVLLYIHVNYIHVISLFMTQGRSSTAHNLHALIQTLICKIIVCICVCKQSSYVYSYSLFLYMYICVAFYNIIILPKLVVSESNA